MKNLTVSAAAIKSILYAVSATLGVATGGNCQQEHTIYNVIALEAQSGLEVVGPFLKQLTLIINRQRGAQYVARIAEYFGAYGLPNELEDNLTPEYQRRALIALQMSFEAAVGPNSFGIYDCTIATPNHAEAWNLIELLIQQRNEIEANA